MYCVGIFFLPRKIMYFCSNVNRIYYTLYWAKSWNHWPGPPQIVLPQKPPQCPFCSLLFDSLSYFPKLPSKLSHVSRLPYSAPATPDWSHLTTKTLYRWSLVIFHLHGLRGSLFQGLLNRTAHKVGWHVPACLGWFMSIIPASLWNLLLSLSNAPWFGQYIVQSH